MDCSASRRISHQEQDLWMANEGQRGGELPAGATAVTVGDDVSVVVELQSLQEVTHHLWRKHLGQLYRGKDLKDTHFNFKSLYVSAHCKGNIED